METVYKGVILRRIYIYVGKCICKGINIIYRYICKASMPTIEEIEAELNE